MPNQVRVDLIWDSFSNLTIISKLVPQHRRTDDLQDPAITG